MDWNALIRRRIFDGESPLYGMVANKEIKYKNEEQNREYSARVDIYLLDLDEAVVALGLLLWGRLQHIQ